MPHKSLIAFCVFILIIGCISKKITKPILTEAVVTVSSHVFHSFGTNGSWLAAQYKFNACNNKTYTFYRDITGQILHPVVGDKYIIVYDSLNPGWWEFDESQCGPFFYPNEKVDTTIGHVYLVDYYGKNPRKIIFQYLYNVKDSFFRKRVDCSDTSLYRNIAQGKKFPVIYDPNNKGRAKMLFEPPGKKKVIP